MCENKTKAMSKQISKKIRFSNILPVLTIVTALSLILIDSILPFVKLAVE